MYDDVFVSRLAKKLSIDLPLPIARIDNGMMRPLLPFVILVGACGDNVDVDDLVDVEHDPAFEADEASTHEEETPAARLIPDVCTVRSWTTVLHDGRNVDLSVAGTAEGAAIFTVSRTGGPLRGFTVDARSMLTGDPAGTILRGDHKFTATAATVADDHYITASVVDGNIAIDKMPLDLSDRTSVGDVRGTLVADMPLLTHRAERSAPIGGDTGLSNVAFDESWNITGATTLTPEPPVSLTATSYRGDALVSWSTAGTCHTRRVSAQIDAQTDYACPGARLAANHINGDAMLVFTSEDRLMRADVTLGNIDRITNPMPLVSHDYKPTSPRIVFDGARYWVSYINMRGDMVVGFVEKDGSLAAMALEGTQPEPDAYELAYVNNGVWLFTVDAAGVSAQRLCAKPAS